MVKALIVILIQVLLTSAQAAEVYHCVEHGTMLLSDKPCSMSAEQRGIIQIGEQSAVIPGSTSVINAAPPVKTPADMKRIQIPRQGLIGQWQLTGPLGREHRNFHADGTFESYKKTTLSEVKASGSWTLHGNKLTIDVNFENVMANGEQLMVEMTLIYRVLSVDDTSMTLYWNQYGSREQWLRQ